MTPEQVIQAAAEVFALHPNDITSNSRNIRCVMARHCIAAILHERGMKIADIAKVLRRDRPSVYNSIKKDREFADVYLMYQRMREEVQK